VNLAEFRRSLKCEHPPRGLAAPARALWQDANGDWERAHKIVAAESTRAAARVHAYLHRKEGDSKNADYWYTRAGAERPHASLRKEWEALARSFLDEE
jgi:hypothetical protein